MGMREMKSPLYVTVRTTISEALAHVHDCQKCRVHGRFCCICSNPRPIFPFDLDAYKECEQCKQVFHARCFDRSSGCPTCALRRPEPSKSMSRQHLNANR